MEILAQVLKHRARGGEVTDLAAFTAMQVTDGVRIHIRNVLDKVSDQARAAHLRT
jgi:hypothetical protein